MKELELSLHNNISLIYLKQKSFVKCIEHCNSSIAIDSNNIKSLIRKSQAIITDDINNNKQEKDYQMAILDLKKVQELILKNNNKNIKKKFNKILYNLIKIANKKIEKLKKRELYASYFAPKPSNKLCMSRLHNYESSKNINCIVSMFACDYMHYSNKKTKKHNEQKLMNFRLSPFDVSYAKSKIKQSLNELVCYDHVELIDYNNNYNIIAYLDIGTERYNNKSLYFETSSFEWPSPRYSLLLWVDFDLQNGNNLITTFDSSGNAPVYVNEKRNIGCAFRAKGDINNGLDSWKCINDYQVEKGWNFVYCESGNMNSTFSIGNLNLKPEIIGSVECDICSEITCRFGNDMQGPGKVACIMVFDEHLNEKEIENVYYETRNEILVKWNNKQMNIIRKCLTKYIAVVQIHDVILQFCIFSHNDDDVAMDRMA